MVNKKYPSIAINCITTQRFCLVCIFLFALFATNLSKLQAQSDSSALQISVSYSTDAAYNFTGGIKTGFAFMGIANIMAQLDVSKLGLWQGGELYFHGASTHGSVLSDDFLGDAQVASNIEAGNNNYLHELYYAQNMGRVRMAFGVMDLNATNMISDFGRLYLNSAFGVPSSLSSGVTLPIFPLTGLGFLVQTDISKNITIDASLFDGIYLPHGENPYNTNWSLSKKDGYLMNAEMKYSTHFYNLPGTIKLGFNFHSEYQETDETGNLQNGFQTFAPYLIIDQQLSTSETGVQYGAFVQLSTFIGKHPANWLYAGVGFNVWGFSNANPQNTIGLALAHAAIDAEPGNETAIELTFKAQLLNNFYVQPDVQYIINPAGTGVTLDNALVGIFRCGFEF